MGNDANDGHLSLIISGARLPSMMIVIGSGSSRAEQNKDMEQAVDSEAKWA